MEALVKKSFLSYFCCMKQQVGRLFTAVILLILPMIIQAQCSTCAGAAESSLQQGSTAAKGLNDGILYLLAIPAIAVVVFYLLYKKRQQFLAKFEN